MTTSTRHTLPGQSMVEIGVMIALVAVIAAVGLSTTGTSVDTAMCQVVSAFGGGDCGTRLLFADDFTNMNAWERAAGTWKIDNGELSGGPGEGRLFTPIPADDYTIDIDTARLSQGNGYGVFFRTENFGKVNGYTFQYDPGLQGFAFRKWVNGSEISTPIAIAKAPNYDWYNSDRKLQITVKGDTFTASIDGQHVLTTSDSTYTSGGIGLRTWDSTQASFDNLSVYSVR
ncbi:DUF1080 domain-containing protein [Oscillochloris sp. ZM17-4]|uniref:family 16 glycoside hydrolase n=1 Tax=Oscillochloris sp. ZM17-4 TaxID=2866714 RepID=UPI001C72FFDF|nr:family 16 glycoside hydrolase [Oscillochloris sp. ZM17-4]MBX0326706.1 DUF1080 domain-containing protein [Oscillochloris sp. ZM17-4]